MTSTQIKHVVVQKKQPRKAELISRKTEDKFHTQKGIKLDYLSVQPNFIKVKIIIKVGDLLEDLFVLSQV